MSKLAQLIAREEGFYVPGSLPNRNNNPGDLRHAPGETHAGNPNAVGAFDTVEEGWAALERQLGLYAERGLTLSQMVDSYAPPSDDNDSVQYLQFLCDGLGCTPDTLVSQALDVPGDPDV